MMKSYRSFDKQRKALSLEARNLPIRANGADIANLEERAAMISALELHGAHLDDLEQRMAANPKIPKSPWEGGFGTFLQAVRLAAVSRDQIDVRLQSRVATGLNESTPNASGFLVPSQWANDLLNRSLLSSRVASLCSRFTVTNGNKLLMPLTDETSRATGSRWGGVSSYWENEADTVTASKPKVRLLDMELQKITGLVYATDELFQDGPLLSRFVSQAFEEEFAFRLDDAVLNGSGTGQPLGILNAPAVYTVAKETGQTAGTIVNQNLVNMYSHMLARNKPNSVWLISDDVDNMLYSSPTGAGGSNLPSGIFVEPAEAEQYGRIFGRPVIPVEQALPIGNRGDIMLVDLNDYLIADRAMNTAVSLHVRFLWDEQVFRFTYRVDGQPSLRTPITPYQGTDVKSAYVALATRS